VKTDNDSNNCNTQRTIWSSFKMLTFPCCLLRGPSGRAGIPGEGAWRNTSLSGTCFLRLWWNLACLLLRWSENERGTQMMDDWFTSLAIVQINFNTIKAESAVVWTSSIKLCCVGVGRIYLWVSLSIFFLPVI